MKGQNLDLLAIERHLSSVNFTIPTTQIASLLKKINQWISSDNGGIVYGNSRVGKTRAIHYLSEKLKLIYGAQMPIYKYCATAHQVRESAFYSSMLAAIGHDEPFRGTAEKMKLRLIGRMLEDARRSKYRRVILFIDEAYLLDSKEYIWLIDIYNRLANEDVIFTVLLFGTYELKNQKTLFKRAGKEQIIHRFMSREVEFKGITSLQDMQICFSCLDEPFKVKGHRQEVILSRLYFPQACQDGYTLADFADNMWKAFEKVKRKYNIDQSDILMKHFMDAVFYCFKYYGFYGQSLYIPSVNEWIETLKEIGYIECYAKE